MIMYYSPKSRPVREVEIRTTVYNILRNTEAIGNTSMDYDLLLQRTGEHLEELRLTYNKGQLENEVKAMIKDKLLLKIGEDEIGLIQ